MIISFNILHVLGISGHLLCCELDLSSLLSDETDIVTTQKLSEDLYLYPHHKNNQEGHQPGVIMGRSDQQVEESEKCAFVALVCVIFHAVALTAALLPSISVK